LPWFDKLTTRLEETPPRPSPSSWACRRTAKRCGPWVPDIRSREFRD